MIGQGEGDGNNTHKITELGVDFKMESDKIFSMELAPFSIKLGILQNAITAIYKLRSLDAGQVHSKTKFGTPHLYHI